MARKRPVGKRRKAAPKPPQRKPFQPTHGHILALLFLATLVVYNRILSPSVMVAATDQLTAGYMFKEFAARVLRHLHQFPLWDPYIFAGLPYIDALHGDMFYLTALARVILPTHLVLNWTFILHTFLAGVTTYFLLLDLKLDRLGAGLFGMAYMLSATLVSLAYPGHDGKLVVSAFFPLMLFLLLRGLRSGRLRWYALNALLTGYLTLSVHIQMLYYAYMALGITFLVFWAPMLRETPREGLKHLTFFVLMVALSLGTAMLRFIPAYYYTAHFSPRAGEGRGFAFAASWALPWEDLISSFLPRFSGYQETYWGHNPFKINSEYMGFLPWTFALLGFTWIRERKLRLALALLALLFTLIAVGDRTPFFRLFYEILPGFKRFRAHSMAWYIVNLSFVVAGALAYREARERGISKALDRRMLYVAGFTGLLFLFVAAGKGIIASLFLESGMSEKAQAFQQNYAHALNGALRVFLLTGLTFWFFRLHLQDKLKAPAFTLLAAAALFLDLYLVDSDFIRTVPHPSRYYAPDAVVKFLEQDKGTYRVFPLFYRTDNNYLMLYDIESIGGHHGNQLRRFQEYIGSPQTIMFRPQLVTNLYDYPWFTDMLDVKYIVTQRLPGPQDLSRLSPEAQALLSRIFRLLHRPGMERKSVGGDLEVYINGNNLGRVWFVQSYTILESDRVLNFMKSPSFDPRKVAVLEEDPGVELVPDTAFQGRYEILEKTPNRVRLRVEVSSPCLMIYAENYYPSIRAKVDGNPARVYPTNYILRGLFLPAGTHTVELYFDPIQAKKGLWLTLISVLIALGLVGLDLWRRPRT